MYNTQNIANRIREQIKLKKTVSKDMLASCGLNVNAISELAKGKQMSCISLAKIADCLNVSVDYLLGRTDDPVLHKKAVTFTVEDEPLYVVKFAGRNGKLTEEYMTAQQIEELKKKIDSLPEADF